MDELTKVSGLCVKLGAAPAQADAMAKQLLKRADQLAMERKQSREKSMAYLLRLLIQGRSGVVPDEIVPDGDDLKKRL